MENNLENIKVGDPVAYCSSGIYTAMCIAKVTRVTEKQFEVGPSRFWKKNGTKVGNKFIKCRRVTAEDILRYKTEKRRSTLMSKLMDFFDMYDSVNTLSLEQLEQIEAIINSNRLHHSQ